MSSTVRGINVIERGAGPPLLLVHGSGLSHHVWAPLVPLLEDRRRLLLIDLPGHGAPELPSLEPDPIGFATALEGMLDELGLGRVHIVGNSVGGWTALELAKRGRAHSVVAMAPAGMWVRNPWSARTHLLASYHASRLLRPMAPALARTRAGRVALMRGGFARPRHVPPFAVVELVRAMADARDFHAHVRVTRRTRFVGGDAIDVPVLVAWGDSERVLPRRARLRDELPASVRVVELAACGHLMTWDVPERLAELILEQSRG